MTEPTEPNVLDRIRRMSDQAKHDFIVWLSGYKSYELDRWLDLFESRPAAALYAAQAAAECPADVSEHRTKTRQLPGGPIEVRCSCGKWSGVAPTQAAADRALLAALSATEVKPIRNVPSVNRALRQIDEIVNRLTCLSDTQKVDIIFGIALPLAAKARRELGGQ